MTDYNDGKWHGWNGGECPVHPKTQVDAVCTSIVPSGYGRATWKTAGEIDWAVGIPSEVIAFRVIKPYREPREVWMRCEYTNCWYQSYKGEEGAVLFREVTE